MESLPSDHFLARASPPFAPPGAGFPSLGADAFDTATLAAHDFDVDERTGFMPPQPPLARLPERWEAWEAALDDACHRRLQLAIKPTVTPTQTADSAAWRAGIRGMPVIDHTDIRGERVLRRAHLVLAWLMHFYVHTLPLNAPIIIPRSIARPLLSICAVLQLPPVLTYSDDVLYNWIFADGAPGGARVPSPDDITTQTTFTGTSDEAEFYLASARIELRGVNALSLMSSIADEAFIDDAVARTRITVYLRALAGVIETLSETLLAVRAGCDPLVFYDDIRPWFKGEDAAPGARRWVFEGATTEDAPWTRELSGPSAGQSSLVHALDVFLGVAEQTHSAGLTGHSAPAATVHTKPFLERMQAYMPRHHRAFLTHLAASPTPLRALVTSHAADAPEIVAAYNSAVAALKSFRDAHMRIVAIYIVGPARRAAEHEAKAREDVQDKGRWLGVEQGEELKGTGGTELVRFLKGVRDRTTGALLSS